MHKAFDELIAYRSLMGAQYIFLFSKRESQESHNQVFKVICWNFFIDNRLMSITLTAEAAREIMRWIR